MASATVLALVGATAIGKTDVAEALAGAGIEIVCADSRQVFRELVAGTGKPSREALAAAPHHLFDALSLEQRPSAGWFARAAGEACAAIHARGAVPLLVGGSGLYVNAARYGLAETPPHDAAARERLRGEARTRGAAALHADLARADPATAARLDPRDTQRVARALEVLAATGKPLSWWHAQPRRPAVPGTWRVVELTCPAHELRARIGERTRRMFESGLIEETRALLDQGREGALRAVSAIGYDEALELVRGRLTRAAAEAQTWLRTVQLAKRQRTWFRHQLEATRVPGSATPDALVTRVREALGL